MSGTSRAARGSQPPLVLLAHGSRYPARYPPLARTVQQVRTALPRVEVRSGYVDLQEPGPEAALEGLTGPVVLPFFLARGYHVLHDVPAAVHRHGSGTVTTHLGSDSQVVTVVAQRLDQAARHLGGTEALDHVVLGAAGSRNRAALAEVEAVSARLSQLLGLPVTTAYLSASGPSVAQAVRSARLRGAARVGVATYLLAQGRFHQALGTTGADIVADPVGGHPGLAEVVARRYLQAVDRQQPGTTPSLPLYPSVLPALAGLSARHPQA
ncbi:sirohydrochlorin chelatase [Actinomyces sp. 2119]|uniref:sirohydrochlorin chelatase n=1 Tax=Actinomyces sp. 2119 TaxID=2321393 RepID=UPI000E6BCD1C|nr:CbiX/SirB N-terminal domain-containing protein [Actinomyces sp. 2119]RJF43132.1 sirohydrochlorin chelatase [Actinomyces sp. 2119]